MPSFLEFAHYVFLLTLHSAWITSTTPINETHLNTSTVQTLASTGKIITKSPVFNVSANLPPSGFSIYITNPDRNVPVVRNAAFASTSRALADLVEKPFDSQTTGLQIFRSQRFPGVDLAVAGDSTPPLRGGFTVKYIIWGLTLAIKYMVDRNDFRSWQFQLKWQNNVVGQIWFFYRSPPESIEATASSNSDADSLTPVKTTVDLPGNGLKVSLKFEICDTHSQAVNINDIMMVVFGGLNEIAPHDIGALVVGGNFMTMLPPYRAGFDLGLVETHFSPLRGPWFTYDVVRTALVIVASWYLSQPDSQFYWPVQIEMVVNLRIVGIGKLFLPEESLMGGVGNAGESGNVSIA